MIDLLSWHDWVANACYVILAASYLVGSMIWLRALAVVSLGCEGVYFYFAADIPLWVGLSWTIVFVAINLLQLAVLARHAIRVRKSRDERMLRTGMFAGLDLASLGRLMRAGAWRDLPTGSVLTREGEAVDDVYLLVRGAAQVATGGRTVAVLQPGSFAGEMSFLSGQPASATVTTIEHSRVFAIAQHELRRLMGKNRQMRGVLQERFSADLVMKLRGATHAI
jgi:hypothetical protein